MEDDEDALLSVIHEIRSSCRRGSSKVQDESIEAEFWEKEENWSKYYKLTTLKPTTRTLKKQNILKTLMIFLQVGYLL